MAVPLPPATSHTATRCYTADREQVPETRESRPCNETRFPQQTSQEPHIRTPSIELPIFTGENAAAWIQECESVFELAGVAPENKIKWANAHIRGKAKTWITSYSFEMYLMNWSQFCSLLCDIFPSSGAKETMELCQQLKQTSTVEHYIEQFEQWMLDMKRDHSYLPEGFFLLRFITGLKDTIKHDTQCHKPATLRAAYWFARKQELSYMSNKKTVGGPSNRSYTGNIPARNPIPRDTRPRPPAERPQERGKYWYCPKNWSYGHKCNEVKNLMHAIQLQGHSDEEEEDLVEQQNDTIPNLPEEPLVQDNGQKEKLMSISLTAMEGIQGDDIIFLCVVIGGVNAIALVDSGSSNTFIDYDFAVKLNLPMRNTTTRTVTVAGGGTLVPDTIVQ
jgi:hypothetical protein